MAIVFVGIDLAKNGFAVHGVNPAGKPERVRPSVPRAKLHEMIAALPPCTIGMEACSGGSSLGQVVSGAGSHGEAHGAEVRRAVPPDRQARQGYVEARTATINRVRGLLSEVGIVLPLKAETVRREAMAQLEDWPGWVLGGPGLMASKSTGRPQADEWIPRQDPRPSLASTDGWVMDVRHWRSAPPSPT
jgi:transposase